MATRQVPVTASRAQQAAQRPVLTTPNTSADAERMISQGPANLSNEYGIKNLPAPVNRNFGKDQTAGLPSSKMLGTPKGGYNVTAVGCAAAANTSAEMMAAVGYGPDATKSSNPIISGRPTQNNTRRVGNGNQPKAGRG